MNKDDQINEIMNGPKKGLWQDRLRTVISTLVFCAVCVLYIMISGKDTSTYQTIIMGCFSLAGAVIATFLGAQTYHDSNMARINAVANIRQSQTINTSTISSEEQVLVNANNQNPIESEK